MFSLFEELTNKSARQDRKRKKTIMSNDVPITNR